MPAILPLTCQGKAVLASPQFNKGDSTSLQTRLIRGTAFTHDERRTFKLAGLLPSRINDLELQAERYDMLISGLLIVERMASMRVTRPTFSRTPFSNLSMTKIKYPLLIRLKLMIGSLLQTFERSSQGLQHPRVLRLISGNDAHHLHPYGRRRYHGIL